MEQWPLHCPSGREGTLRPDETLVLDLTGNWGFVTGSRWHSSGSGFLRNSSGRRFIFVRSNMNMTYSSGRPNLRPGEHLPKIAYSSGRPNLRPDEPLSRTDLIFPRFGPTQREPSAQPKITKINPWVAWHTGYHLQLESTQSNTHTINYDSAKLVVWTRAKIQGMQVWHVNHNQTKSSPLKTVHGHHLYSKTPFTHNIKGVCHFFQKSSINTSKMVK